MGRKKNPREKKDPKPPKSHETAKYKNVSLKLEKDTEVLSFPQQLHSSPLCIWTEDDFKA